MSKNLFGEEQAEKEVQDLIRAVLAPYAKVWNITTEESYMWVLEQFNK